MVLREKSSNFAALVVIGCALNVTFGQTCCLGEEILPAARIYQEKCAACHGEHGEGVAEGYDRPFEGNMSVHELAEFIDSSMPEDNPDRCVGDEARSVAAYIHEQFYDDISKAERQSGLSRLTVDQHRNALSDLVARFTPPPRNRRRDREPSSAPGFHADYFQSEGMSKANELILSRVDPHVAFDFGQDSPTDGITADQFAIIWRGALLVGETGEYQFRIATQNGARLYLNLDPGPDRGKLRDDSASHGQPPLIDAWVGSGEMRTATTRVFLLGERPYPIRVEFFKYLEETASVKLEWKPPHGVWQVLDASRVETSPAVRVFVPTTPFPPDDGSRGYERGSDVSEEWHAAATSAAAETAEEVVDRLALLSGVASDAADRNGKVVEFVHRFATAAYRRPLSDSEKAALEQDVLSSFDDIEAGIYRTIVRTLMSPYFLYADLPTSASSSQYRVASRLALAIWDSIPDEPLLAAATEGRLATAEEIAEQALRMMDHPRTRLKVRRFFEHWLELDQRDLVKDKQEFPEFDETVVADLRRSLELFVERVFWSPQSDFRELLLADYLVLNDRLREIYAPASAGAEAADPAAGNDAALNQESADLKFREVPFAARERSGILTHPYLLSAFAYHNSTSPIHRGVFLTRNIMGRRLNPPPEAVAFDDSQFSPDLTMREKVTELTRDAACMSCHSIINPLGFSLEHFDAVGRWRECDAGKPVEAASQYATATGDTLEITSARDIADFAVSSKSARQALVTQTFQHMVKRDPLEFDPDLVEQLAEAFAANGYNMQNLWVRIAAIAAAIDGPIDE